MHPLTITIASDGNTSLIFHPDKQPDARELGAALGTVVADRRGGYVYPASAVKRAAFRLVRRLFGSGGRVADWTRTWRGPWVVIVAATGERLPGTYRTHGDAVTAEVTWLIHQLGG